MQQDITDLEAKVTALESELGIPSGSQFTSQTVHVPFTELNMEPQVAFTVFSEPGVVEIGQHDHYSLSITSLREGQVKAYMPDEFGGISIIQVTVSADGAIDYNVIPWVEGSVRGFALSELNMYGIVTVSQSNPDVVDIIGVGGFYNVVALSEGSTVITVLDSEGKEARIEVTVDQNRSITTFTVFPVPINYFRDNDQDGYGLSADYRLGNSPEGYYTVTQGGDFNDNDPYSYPGAPEIPDGRDNDGDGEIDEGTVGTIYYRDEDQDGYGSTEYPHFGMEYSDFIIAEAPVYPYTALVSGDWVDTEPSINPGAEEIVDGIDNNCDGIVY